MTVYVSPQALLWLGLLSLAVPILGGLALLVGTTWERHRQRRRLREYRRRTGCGS